MMEDIFLDCHNLPKRLDDNEMVDLINKSKLGDINARNEFIVHNIRLVLKRVSTRFKFIDYDKKELVSIGVVGLIKAVDNYDINKKSSFSTYAIKCIDNEVLIFLRNLYRKNKLKIVSFDSIISPIKEKDTDSLKQIDIIKNSVNLEQEYINKETNLIIKKIINGLSLKEQKIIKMYFGFDGYNYSKKEDIAKELGISRAYLYEQLSKILNKIRRRLLEENIYIDYKKVLKH